MLGLLLVPIMEEEVDVANTEERGQGLGKLER
ncbi:unnamed protein product, partial [Cuscuta epithymum]